MNARQKASIAAGVLAGEAVIELSARQVAQLFGVSVPYINAASELSPAKRQAIANGTDSTPVTTLIKPSSTLALPKPVSDAALADIVRGAGIDRVLAVACTVEQNAAA